MTARNQCVNQVAAQIPAAGAIRCELGHSRRILSRSLLSSGSPDEPGGLGEVLRINPFASLFAASLIILAPSHALAQTQQVEQVSRQESVSVRGRDRPEYDAPGRRLGAFNLNASLDLAVTSTDNLFAAPKGEPSDVSDVYYGIAPNVALSSDWSRHAVTFDAGARFVTHEDFGGEDSDTNYFRGTGRFDIGDNTALRGSARSSHEVSPRTDPDSPYIGAPVEYDRMDTGVGITHRFARVNVSLDAVNSEYNYDGAQAFRDNEESAIRGRIEAELSPRVGLLFSASVDERDYNNSPQFNSEGQAYMVGVSLNTDLMRGEIQVGQFERDYAGIANTFDGLAIEGHLEWYVTQLTTVTLDARRDADDQIGAASGLPYTTEEYGLRVDHELLRNLILTGGMRAGNRDYVTIAREDEYTKWDVGADYMLNPHAAVRFRYQYDEVDSPAYRNYEVNQATLGLTLRL